MDSWLIFQPFRAYAFARVRAFTVTQFLDPGGLLDFRILSSDRESWTRKLPRKAVIALYALESVP